MKSVFVVFGQCGEYSDRQEWPVKAFLTWEAAEACCDRCNDYAKKVEGLEDYVDRSAALARNPDDPAMMTNYTGTEYYMVEIEMGDAMTAQEIAVD